MLCRRYRKVFARCCVALLGMQAVAAAYACPAFLGELPPALAQASSHETHQATMAGHCEEQPAGNTGNTTTLCHEHYAGDQSVGSGSLGAAAAAPALPVLFAPALEPVARSGGATVLPLLLARTTAPPLAIRFVVLRI